MGDHLFVYINPGGYWNGEIHGRGYWPGYGRKD